MKQLLSDIEEYKLGICVALLLIVCSYELWGFYSKSLKLKRDRKALCAGWKKNVSAAYLEKHSMRTVIQPSMYTWLPEKSCLVTGGNGFLGKQVVECLLSLGCRVRVMDLADSCPNDKVEYVKGNLCKREDVERACAGNIHVVFHCATPNPLSPNAKLLHDVNVGGTKLLLAVCEEHSIERFVYTSSASVVFDGTNQANATEEQTATYPTHFRDVYSLTKALAEELVLQHSGAMKTVAIRPHGIFGPGDMHFFPTVEKNAAKGKTKFQIGDGHNTADFTYVGNVVHGLFLAADHVDRENVARQAFFITNDAPVRFWDMLSQVLIGLGYNPPSISLPYALCFAAAIVAEGFGQAALYLTGKPIELTFNRSKVQLAGLDHWYSCEKAKKRLAYRPLWTMDEALACTFSSRLQPSTTTTTRTFTRDQVSQHNTANDAWIIVKNRVFDITEYVEEHPGGEAILNDVGRDATAGFYGPQHPPTVQDHLELYYIGELKE